MSVVGLYIMTICALLLISYFFIVAAWYAIDVLIDKEDSIGDKIVAGLFLTMILGLVLYLIGK